MKNALILLFAVITCLTHWVPIYPAERRSLEFERLGVARGLSQSTVNCILQDSKGFMWFGTGSGLNKYDGNTMTVYRNNSGSLNSLSDDIVLGLCETPDQIIWIGTSQGGLNRFDPRTGTFTRFTFSPGGASGDSVNVPQVRKLMTGKDGNLWLATFGGGLNKYDPRTKTFSYYLFKKEPATYPLFWKRNALWAMDIGSDGIIWAGTHDGLVRFNPGNEEIKLFQPTKDKPGGLSHIVVYAVLVSRNGTVWAGTSDGLNRLNRDGRTFRVYRHDPNNTYSISRDEIYALYEDDTGGIWAGTGQDGLNYFDVDSERFFHYRYNSLNPLSLSDNTIRSIFQSKDGLLWVGTDGGGVNKLDRFRRKMTCYRQGSLRFSGLSNGSVSCVYEDNDEILWIGTNAGGLNRMDRSTQMVTAYMHNPEDPKSLRHNKITGIVEGKKGYLWLSTHHGLHRFHRETGDFVYYLADYKNPRAFVADQMGALALDPSGKLWVAIPGAGVSLFDPETALVTNYMAKGENPSGLSQDWVSTLYVDSNGTLWAGTMYGGLNRFNGNTGANSPGFTSYQASVNNPSSISDNDIFDIYESRDGTLWIGTGGGGLNKMDRANGTFTRYTSRDGLADNVVTAILEDDDGMLWLSTFRGISRFNPAYPGFKNFDLRDGLQGYEFNSGAAFKNKKGELFFGGVGGLNVFHPNQVQDNKNIPEIVFTAFKRFNQPVTIGGGSELRRHITYTREITLPYSKNFFSLEFAALDYANPPNNRYSYKLDRVHDAWVPLGHRHDIHLTGLEPGSYRLHVNGSNNDGHWNDTGTYLDIIIKPPLWATWWFRMLVVLSIGGLALLWHRNRMNRISLELKTETQLNRLFTKFGISEREQDVLRLALKGKTNNDIEDELFISLPTVKKHLYNVYKKMGVKNRLELINFVQRSIPSNGKEGRRQVKAKIKI